MCACANNSIFHSSPTNTSFLGLIVEEAIASLSTMQQEIFFMRYGEGLPIRTIAMKLGYSSHQIIQAKIARIQKEVREYVKSKMDQK